MASIVFDKLKQPVFNLFYIMTEGVQVEAGFAAYRKTIFLLFVDVLQVLRVLCSLRYGWTKDTQGIIQKTDIVYMFTDLVSQVIPRYSFFILAAVLVLVALLDSYYVVQLFKAGNVQKLWPVKLLRFLVASLVTILFSSVIKWLLIPIECLVSEEKSFSEFVHDEESRCTPWGMPEVMISIPTILLAAAYIIFALGTSYLAFEINPLSRNPRAMHTGRVELLFAINKVAVTLLIYISDLVTPVVISIIFFLWTLHVFRQHIKILPYHSAVTNNVRGGIYGMVLWFSFATIIVASIKLSRNDTWETEEHPAWLQPLQWALAGLIPLAFVGGLSLTAIMQYRVGRSLLRLRGDFEKPLDAATAHHGGSSDDGKARGAPSSNSPLRHTRPTSFSPISPVLVARGAKRGVFEKFFDTEWENRRRFVHEWRAGVLIRHLLHNRNIHDLAFMQYLVGKALQEHPESALLQLQLLVLHRFVFRDSSEANEIQRALKLDQKALPIDFQFILFVAERKSNQAMRGTDLGGGGAVTGIRLMEFDISFERARKAHLACVSKMRTFWRRVEKKRSAAFDLAQATDMVKDLDEYEEQIAIAKKEYEILVEKYPQSVQLLRSYAHFCDTVSNEFRKAETFQKNAALLEGEELEEEEEEEEGHGGNGELGSKELVMEKEGGGSTYSSEAEPYRVTMQRYLESQSEHMMGHEAKVVHRLHYKVGLALLLLLIMATAGFFLNDTYLFSGLALHNLDQIDKTGLLRSYAINTGFLLRSLQLAAHRNDTAAYEKHHLEIVDMMETWRMRHRENYENMQSKLKTYYLDSQLQSYIPIENKWEIHFDNFWSLASEFARRSERAAHTPADEMKDPGWLLGTMGYEKENVAYVYENLERETRKSLRVVVDIFEGEMRQFGVLATGLVITNVTVNALLVLLIAYFVLRALAREMHDMQSALVFCSLALALPRSTANAIYKYYDAVELNMKIVEDEEAERNAIMQSDAGTTAKRRGSMLDTDGLPNALTQLPSNESTSPHAECVRGSFEGGDVNDVKAGSTFQLQAVPHRSIMRPSSSEPRPWTANDVPESPRGSVSPRSQSPCLSPLSRVFLKQHEKQHAEGEEDSDGSAPLSPGLNKRVSNTIKYWLTSEVREKVQSDIEPVDLVALMAESGGRRAAPSYQEKPQSQIEVCGAETVEGEGQGQGGGGGVGGAVRRGAGGCARGRPRQHAQAQAAQPRLPPQPQGPPARQARAGAREPEQHEPRAQHHQVRRSQAGRQGPRPARQSRRRRAARQLRGREQGEPRQGCAHAAAVAHARGGLHGGLRGRARHLYLQHGLPLPPHQRPRQPRAHSQPSRAPALARRVVRALLAGAGAQRRVLAHGERGARGGLAVLPGRVPRGGRGRAPGRGQGHPRGLRLPQQDPQRGHVRRGVQVARGSLGLLDGGLPRPRGREPPRAQLPHQVLRGRDSEGAGSLRAGPRRQPRVAQAQGGGREPGAVLGGAHGPGAREAADGGHGPQVCDGGVRRGRARGAREHAHDLPRGDGARAEHGAVGAAAALRHLRRRRRLPLLLAPLPPHRPPRALRGPARAWPRHGHADARAQEGERPGHRRLLQPRRAQRRRRGREPPRDRRRLCLARPSPSPSPSPSLSSVPRSGPGKTRRRTPTRRNLG